MTKRQLPRYLEFTAYRHQTNVAIIAHPDRRLVSSQKSLDRRVLIIVWADTDLVLTSHHRPMRHAERGGDSRDHAAVIILGWTCGADHWINAIDWLLSESLEASAKINSEAHRNSNGDDRDRSSGLNRNEHKQTPPK